MSFEISKELLSEVLKVNVTYTEKLIGNTLGFKTNNVDFTHLINIYELAHKCKEWALTKGYVILEYPLIVHIYNENTKEKVHAEGDLTTIAFYTIRVIKSAQWILDNKDKQ